ncbi:uncharacterized protein [Rutidosis leptorrhynchoides]|uniref:uncharacterized protein n=1 Tax=Rutidosis leptorrhynchoides TaxID=125765 RepID=UPI003A99B40F
MEEFASLWSYQENIDDLKQKLFYTTLELEAVKSETQDEIKRNNDSMNQLLQLLKMTCQERDEAKDQLQKLLNKIMPLNEQQIFNASNAPIPNCFTSDQVQQLHQSTLMMPNKANSSVTESNSFSEAYNRSSSPVDSLFDPISSPEFSNVNVETQFVQDYNQKSSYSTTFNGLNMPKVDQATLMMEGMIKGKTLPQKGNLLRAVIEAGPLLHNLLVAGPLPRWRNPPPLQTFNVPPMLTTIDHITAAQKLDMGSQKPMMVLKPSQPYAEMACGGASQILAAGGGSGSGGVLSFGDFSFGSNFQGRMMTGCSGGSNFGTIQKRQRLH